MTKSVFSLPLQGDFSARGDIPVEITGPHRFVEIGGRVGYHPTSLRTRLRLATNLHAGDRGTIAMLVCPLESLSAAAPMAHVLSKDPNASEFGLIGDTFPVGNIPDSIFCWYWRAVFHPQMIAKFKNGVAAGGAADYGVTPYVPVEQLPLRERSWYHLTLTWDKPESSLRVYVNGVLAGATVYPFTCDTPKPELFLGNTAMVFAGVELYDATLSDAEVAAAAKAVVDANSDAAKEVVALYRPQPRPAVDWKPDAAWALRYSSDFTKPGDFDGWSQQGCLEEPYKLDALEITDEGLLIQTPEQVHVETRVYFWSPEVYEGDLAVEFDFRVEKDTGLALLVTQATGFQREDFLTDHPKRTTGGMGTIIADRVRNYHWEFFRRSVDCRADLGTHLLVKNTWCRPMQMATTPPISLNTWHKVLFVQEGARIRAAFDGEWVLDAQDSAFDNNGPVLNSGRIGLRMMYATRMRYRNMRIWNRPHFTVGKEVK